MKAIMVMFDSLNKKYLPNYGCEWTKMPNFKRLGDKTLTFDNFYGGSMPCMPARRELHTGRYNFLHRGWTPLEPFDDSVVTRLKKSGVYTHIATDHFHYWEDGGAGYLTQYDSFDAIRGQQGDPWKGQVEWPDFPDTLSNRKAGQNWRHDWVNRSFINKEEDMPQVQTFGAGLDFIDRNKDKDNWFLQIEAFDPHEPFYTQQQYKDLYPHEYNGKQMDWPDYGKNDLTDEETQHVKYEYASLLSMCDAYLGKVLDMMDENNLWEDTMLIVNTDHGFMLGEKEWMGKNVQPFYNEVINTPFFIYDPRNPIKGERRSALAQTVDIVPTLAEFFEIDPPNHMDGKPLTPVVKEDKKIREGALFGIHGGHINVTDGRYVYMQAAQNPQNMPLYEYTLIPYHMNSMFNVNELKNIELTDEFEFTRECKIMKIPTKVMFGSYWFGNMLFDLEKDPNQESMIQDDDIQIKMIELMREMMINNEAPEEQFIRVGIPKDGIIDKKLLDEYKKNSVIKVDDERLRLTNGGEKALVIFSNMMPGGDKLVSILADVCKEQENPVDEDGVIECAKQLLNPMFAGMACKMVKTFLNIK